MVEHQVLDKAWFPMWSYFKIVGLYEVRYTTF